MDLRDLQEFLRDFAGYVASVGVILFIFVFIVALHPIAGNSMTPSLEEGEVVLVSKLKIGAINRDDIVVIKKERKNYVKRVIGLPGEKIEYMNGILFINDKGYKETFLDQNIVTTNFLFVDICSKEDCPDGKIPENKYLVMGDNRPESTDSRDNNFGLVDKDEIKGEVFFRIWPVNELGSVK